MFGALSLDGQSLVIGIAIGVMVCGGGAKSTTPSAFELTRANPRAASAMLLRVGLTAFLGAVGVMKGAGMLRHPLSRLAGPIEAVGALLQLPLCFAGLGMAAEPAVGGLRNVREQETNAAELGSWSISGCHLFMLALGLILSTEKRKGMVCWSAAALTVVYLWLGFPHGATPGGHDGARSAAAALLVALVGVGAGTALQGRYPSL